MSETNLVSETVQQRANECVGWIIENIKFSDLVPAKDISQIIKSAYLSGYNQAELDIHKQYSFEKMKGDL